MSRGGPRTHKLILDNDEFRILTMEADDRVAARSLLGDVAQKIDDALAG